MAGWASGSFTLTGGDTQHAVREAADEGITSTILDADRVELKTGINACLTKDGANAATANLNLGGFKVANMAAATAAGQATEYAQLRAYGRVEARDAAAAAVSNTVAETTLMSLVLPAAVLGTDKTCRVTFFGTSFNNYAGSADFTYRLKFGGTTIATRIQTVLQSATLSAPVLIEAEISNTDSASAQVAATKVSLLGTPLADGSGATPAVQLFRHAGLAINSANAITVLVSVEITTAADVALIATPLNMRLEVF